MWRGLPCTLGGLGVLCIIRGVEEGVLRGEDAVVIDTPSHTVQVAVYTNVKKKLKS